MAFVDPLRSFDGIVRKLSLAGPPRRHDLRRQGPLRRPRVSHGRGQSRLGAHARDRRGDGKQWEAWQAHGQWIRAVHPHFAPSIEASFESAARLTNADRRRALVERDRLMGTLRRHLDGDAVLCLPSASTLAPLKTASAEEFAANRVKDLTLGSVASLSGAPQVSIPVVTESYAIGLGLLAAPGNDARLLALTELLAS